MIPIVVLDGHSGSGKTTLRNYLYEECKSDILVLDRFTPSNWVYSNLRGVDNTREIVDLEDRLNRSCRCFVFICYCGSDEAISRFKLRSRYPEIDVEKEIYKFDEYYLLISRYSNIFMLDTSLNIERCISLIKGAIDEYSREDI